MITHKKAANAISGKTARACESCLTKRARWFCPADDAFLCQACDSLVHSANELAGRHKRVRLGTASFKPVIKSDIDCCKHSQPAWHQGFAKKARTPRYGAKRAKSVQEKHSSNLHIMSLVPEMSGDEGSIEEENEEQMIFSVPTFEPFEVEFDTTLNEEVPGVGLELEDGFNISLIGFGEEENDEWNKLPSDNNLVEFAADVESLLLEQENDDYQLLTTLSFTDKKVAFEKPFSIKNMEGSIDEEIKIDGEKHQDGNLIGCSLPQKWVVKMEDQTESTTDCGHFDWSIDIASDVLNYEVTNYGDKVTSVEEDEKLHEVMTIKEMEDRESNLQAIKRRKTFLRLNYEDVIKAWAGSSPWSTGCRPEFDLGHQGWPSCLGVTGTWGARHQGGDVMRGKGNVDGGDGGREARVSRYREKRQTRLFSKKIRYEVRKLNAEKRPRLKGRFVKRTSLPPAYQ